VAGPSRSAIGLVLQARDYQELDRWIDVLTPSYGKLSFLAKGVRQLKSKRISALQPGSIIAFSWLEYGETKLITEVSLKSQLSPINPQLAVLRDFLAILEIISYISLENIEQMDLYDGTISILEIMKTKPQTYPRGLIRSELQKLLASQGIQLPYTSPADSVSELVESVTQRPIRSFAYLRL
jgi:DNA repair protein RecO